MVTKLFTHKMTILSANNCRDLHYGHTPLNALVSGTDQETALCGVIIISFQEYLILIWNVAHHHGPAL
ncbi:hypothetical protein T06_12931 [Trichinella sp. T6]|nr:hypothetical protein T06_12931 [Trichinella sp. T6]